MRANHNNGLPFPVFTQFSLVYVLIIFSLQIPSAAAAAAANYTLTHSQSIVDGQTLVSQGDKFELGFFTPSPTSNNRYLGIWYKTIPLQTVVWVANRDSPLNDTSGVFKIGSTGNLIIEINRTATVLWSSNISEAMENPILEFLESGNLVLRDVNNNGDSKSYTWQSFDYPSDTLLPGMKLGWNLNTGLNRNLSAWRNFDDPSHGGFSYGMDISGYLEIAMRNGSQKIYRGGPWNGIRFSGSPDLKSNPIFKYEVVHNSEEIYYMYQLVNQSVIFRSMLTRTGTEARLQLLTWVEKTNSWVRLLSIPRDRCDDYALCGPYSTCQVTNVEVCQCLKGFKPKSLQDWSGTDWSEGCEREMPVNCTRGEGFIKYAGVRLPDTTGSWVNSSMNLEQCRLQCLKNCSCMAYANSDIRGGGSGCIMWFTGLLDIRHLSNAGQELYIRMAPSELGSTSNTRRKELVIIVCIILVAGMIVLALGLGSWCIWKKRSLKGGSDNDDIELPLYDLATMTNATNSFSEENKLGEGGFGPVYRGKLKGGQEIAVKRLSKNSIQGVNEFKNEVILISKLQHKNLVRLLGCCIQGEEKMLVYEYMQNKSLDSSIFDEMKSRLLDWQKRFQIILGIARGLLYLHHDSRLRIIHRDLKASNILLDSEMVPKISDFGLARIFARDQVGAKTKRVIGTYGYMSPEYAVDGHFSEKSDVFSFGVLVLEIISGKKNRGFGHPDHELNLLGHAYKLRNEGKSRELVDEWMMNDSCYSEEEVLRCIHIGLLCVQNATEERPSMSSVVLMLSSETVGLPGPLQPGFYWERSNPSIDSSTDKDKDVSNQVTITWLEGR